MNVVIRRVLFLVSLVMPLGAIDLTHAVVVAPAGLPRREAKAVTMLLDEVEKRTEIRWTVAPARPAGAPAVVIEEGSGPAEGYRIRTDASGVVISGNDARGVLYGIGRLLREMRMDKQSAVLPDGLQISTAPKYALRGEQLGYRPKTNSYDGWNVPMWEQYIRDLAVFGANAIELIPPRSDDARDSPLFPLPPIQMMVEMSRLADDYGLDVWIWYPAMDRDYSDPKTVESALKEWGEVFRRLPRIDAVFVPGGDPGHTRPQVLMALLEKQAANLRRYHPKAQMWVSPQSFSAEWMQEFVDILKQQPGWLSGIVYGPQVRMNLPELRAAVPKRYPIRLYPDITHSRQSQYPVPDWDTAYAITEAREVINPRPTQEARIFHLTAPYSIGFLAYSEGCNDDVNKAVWNALAWDPDTPVIEILRQYSRYFVSARDAEGFAQGLLALERNWVGPLATNAGVYITLEQFRSLERAATPQELANWRFQQALYRAYYDAYTRARLLYETGLEDGAMEKLRAARQTGSLVAMDSAQKILDRAVTHRVATDWRARVFELAEALFQSIRMQLSVPRYKAISVGRGANLDTIDVPLNDRTWLESEFARLRALPDESARLEGLEKIIDWTDPGPGGFYDDLGDTANQPHLVGRPLMGFSYRPEWRKSWWNDAETPYETPLKLHYTGLDPQGRYRVRVVYAGDSMGRKIRLTAGNDFEIHPLMQKPFPVRPLEFDIPPRAYAGGELTLTWTGERGLGGNGRGCQVAEVWLIRQPQ